MSHDKLIKALQACHTDDGANCFRSHEYALRRLKAINEIVAEALAGVNAHAGTTALTWDALLDLWEQGANIPVDDVDCIEEEWAGFFPGTPRELVWHWFEEQHPDFVVGEALCERYKRKRGNHE